MADAEFVLDAVIGFLSSPIWNSPVPTFIEQNCVVFDPDEGCHESYIEIHEKYKQMVETLLSSFLKDIGITAEQFTAACKLRGGNSQFSEIQKNVFEQVWAAEDFEVFKRLMIQKNIDLQLQALQLIQQQGQKQLLKPLESSPKPTVNDEDEIMKEVLRISIDEYEKKSKAEKKEEEILQKTLSESFEEHERLQKLAQREKNQLENAIKTCTLSNTEKPKQPTTVAKSSSIQPPKPKEQPITSKTQPEQTEQEKSQENKSKQQEKVGGLPPVSGAVKAKTPADAAASWMSSAKAEAAAAGTTGSMQQKSTMSEEDFKRRTEYLKEQRDKLLQLKKQQREKNLDKFTEEQPKSRPMSARAARTVTSGTKETPSPASPTDDKKLAMRKALANVLKREVIEKN